MRLIIIGGVAGGASAAARARRLSEDAEILMIERGPDVSFANCGLPYHIGEIIPQRGKLLVTTAERLKERFRLDVRTRCEAVAINRAAKTVQVRNLQTGTVTVERYDKLILAPGAAPLLPPLPGNQLPNVFTLRTLGDTDRIKKAVDEGIRRAIIVGGGFIGIELAENFLHRGVAVTMLDTNPQVLPPLDAEMATPLASALRAKGVDLKLCNTIESLSAVPEGMKATLRNGEAVEAQLVVFGIGVRPENALATQSGLETGPRGGVRVNEFLETSDPDIYAAGDVIETADFGSGERIQVPLAGPANRQGRIAAENALGRRTRYRGTQGTAILGFFGHTAALTGASEKVLRKRGTPYRKIYIHPAHHAGYYPGAEGMSLKLLFDPAEGRILGAQAVGGAGVDKRIDILAVAIQAKMTVYDLEEMELSYAPQFGSAKDPINMAGFVAAGLLRGDHPQADWEEVLSSKQIPYLLDVRTPEEYLQGHVQSAVNIPIDELRGRLNELPRDQPIFTYCQVGQRGYLATRILMSGGWNVKNLGGGYKTFQLHQTD